MNNPEEAEVQQGRLFSILPSGRATLAFAETCHEEHGHEDRSQLFPIEKIYMILPCIISQADVAASLQVAIMTMSFVVMVVQAS